MINYRTNHSDALELRIEDKTISIVNLPYDLKGKELLVFLSTRWQSEIRKKYYVANEAIRYSVKDIANGTYFFNIYVGENRYSSYIGYYSAKNICIEIDDKTVGFVEPDYFINNANSVRQNFEVLYTNKQLVEPFHDRIRDAAKEITCGVQTDYLRVKAIHDWVASNVFYDKDSLNFDFYVHRSHSPIRILETLKGVCQGYANLTDALLTILGLRSIIIPCYASEHDTNRVMREFDNRNKETNHVINAVYINNRWLLMDVTWDSHNLYENGIRKRREFMPLTHQYFNPTLFFISGTHRFV